MSTKVFKFSDRFAVPAFLVPAWTYTLLIARPEYYFHLKQTSFIFNSAYLDRMVNHPGGFSEIMASFFMQFFFFRIAGSIILFAIAGIISLLSYHYLNYFYKSSLNRFFALIPLFFSITLTNNYNFPFSVILSVMIVLWLVQVYRIKSFTRLHRLIFYPAGAVLIYYLCGSGYLLLFSALSIFFFISTFSVVNTVAWIVIPLLSYFIPVLAATHVFPVSLQNIHLVFFPSEFYFKAYIPGVAFYFFLISLPLLSLLVLFLKRLNHLAEEVPSNFRKLGTYGAFILWAAVISAAHLATYKGDEKKSAAADYYCYTGQTGKALKAALGIKNYDFKTNLNYNLALDKAGRLGEEYFNFLQVEGINLFYPDFEFRSEWSFLCTDYYYEIGFLSEARHWAYESLVNYPHSPRALKMLVKIHLAEGEYKAAGRCLKILENTLTGKKFASYYRPLVNDTSMFEREITEKRSCKPLEGELSPYPEVRLKQLLEANPQNKKAWEHLALYYILDNQAEKFLKLWENRDTNLTKAVKSFEEALLVFASENKIPADSVGNVRKEVISDFELFNRILKENASNRKLARNILYHELGNTYFFYHEFIYPRVIVPEIENEEYGEPEI